MATPVRLADRTTDCLLRDGEPIDEKAKKACMAFFDARRNVIIGKGSTTAQGTASARRQSP
jgi:hypothetical protein